MKQYDLTMFFDDFERPTVIVGEKPHGRYVRAADLQAWALKLKDVVEGMGHDPRCLSSVPLSAPMGESRFSKCNCKRGEALRLLGEVLG